MEMDFESLKSHAILSPLSMPPTCNSRCEPSVSCSCWHAFTLTLWTLILLQLLHTLSSTNCLGHGVLVQQQKSPFSLVTF